MSHAPLPSQLPPCPDCGHRASLHHLDGCRALVLRSDAPASVCGCPTTLREIVARRFPQPPGEIPERDAAQGRSAPG